MLLHLVLAAALAQEADRPQPSESSLPRPDLDEDIEEVVDELRDEPPRDVEPPGAYDEQDEPVLQEDVGRVDDLPVEPIPLDDEDPAPPDEPEYITVLVIGEQQITAARDEVVRKMESLGWRARRRADGRVIFRGPRAWMGRAVLRPTGDIEFNAPALTLEGPKNPGGDYDPSADLDNQINVGTVGLQMGIPSRDLAARAQAEVREAVQDDVLAYRRMIQQRYFSRYIAELPDRLDALWVQGVPLDGGRPLGDHADRRAAILDFWATRTDTPEGRTVMRTVEIWIREVAQTSPHPFTAAEISAAEARRPDARRLDVLATARPVRVE